MSTVAIGLTRWSWLVIRGSYLVGRISGSVSRQRECAPSSFPRDTRNEIRGTRYAYALFQAFLDLLDQRFGFDGAQNKFHRAQGQAVELVSALPNRGRKKNKRDVFQARIAFHPFDEIEAAFAAHVNIRYDQVGQIVLEQRKRLGRRFGLKHAIA